MQIFERIGAEDYEQVVFCHDRPTGLRAVIAIHSTQLGPALGGTRFYPYESEDAAVEDVLRLAKGMTYKSAAAGLDLGGGKAVVIGDPGRHKTEALLRAYGRFVESLGGRYVTAEDVGTTQADMDIIRRETGHVTGVSRSLGGSGDPSEATAYGVLHAMQAVALRVFGSADLADRHVVVAGVGKVGYALCRHLVEARARLTVSDIVPASIERAVTDFGGVAVPPEKAHTVECDIFSPCALGGILNETTIPNLRCRAIVGSANNQLAVPADAERLRDAGVVYAPDYVVNAGGVVNIAEEIVGYNRQRAYGRVRNIASTIAAVLATADAEGITTLVAADRLAERRMAELSHVGQIRIGSTFDAAGGTRS